MYGKVWAAGDSEQRGMRSKRSVGRWLTSVLCMTLVVGACSGGRLAVDADDQLVPVPAVRLARTTGPFAVTLTAGHPATAVADAVPVAQGDKLDHKEIAAVVDRFPPFKTGGGAVPFKRPPESLPRPRVGATIDKPFGARRPKPKPVPTDNGPLPRAALPADR